MRIAALLLALALGTASPALAAPCERGVYRADSGDFVVLTDVAGARDGAQRYLFRDGRRGTAGAPGALAHCQDGVLAVAGSAQPYPRLGITETPAEFESDGTKLAGLLIEPSAAPAARPLVVMVHGSEKTAAIGTSYPYVFVAQGISAFVYDKRGTGASGGDYTQNFELLADDAAAALTKAQAMAAGRYNRAGFFGGSQGGWVAPLAATRSRADFVAVGFGLLMNPLDEDREQVLSELHAKGYGEADLAEGRELAAATGALAASHVTRGFETLAKVRAKLAATPWAASIEGEYSGDMLRMSDADLRRVGRARFDGLGLIWDYDSMAALRRLNVPQLWVLAGADREAPSDISRARISELIHAGKPIDLYVFPDTDHGMFEFTVNPDGGRTMTHVTEGYYRLLGDWVKGQATGSYGRAERIR